MSKGFARPSTVLRSESACALHVSDLVHGLRVSTIRTPQCLFGSYSRKLNFVLLVFRPPDLDDGVLGVDFAGEGAGGGTGGVRTGIVLVSTTEVSMGDVLEGKCKLDKSASVRAYAGNEAVCIGGYISCDEIGSDACGKFISCMFPISLIIFFQSVEFVISSALCIPSEFIISKISSVIFSPNGKSSVSCILTTGNSPPSTHTCTSPVTAGLFGSSIYGGASGGGITILDNGGVAECTGDVSIFI